jgi:hypothetical protein
MNDLQRFLDKVDQSSTCWIWKAYIQVNGYGQFTIEGRHAYAHRWSYEHFIGPIPSGYQLDHLCRIRSCVRPSHLEPVTHAENMKRGFWAVKRFCPSGHEYTQANTHVWTDHSRRCRLCDRERHRLTSQNAK